ncbi:MAG: hypothetical protein P0S94_00800, partial [Simkaniaceae bacterium]|nr:hypothetical protein [Simkaniaceae bacterium]
MTINDAITRNDLAQIATIKDSFPYNTFGITKVALERIVLHGITFCGVAKLISTCVVWITGSLAFPVIEVALLLGACFIAIKVAKSLIDYDRLDNADSIPYFKQVRDDFELKFIAYEKLLELDVDVKDKVRTMLDDFVRCHSLSRIFKYGLLPENYNKIFALVRKEMTFNQAFEFYRAFEKAKNAHPEGVNYTLAHPRMWRDQLIDEIYDAKKGELRMPLDELLEE